jgi:nicotinate phosphoribosyltransferase
MYRLLPYGIPLALLTDFYQITMAYAYWKCGKAEEEAVFNMFFRKCPFNGNYVVSSGLDFIIDFIENWHISDEDIYYLKKLNMFPDEFLSYLSKLRMEVDVYSMSEGTFAFPNEPMLRVHGPIIQGQLLESPLLTINNFNSLIATKAHRICRAANGKPVIDFGLRRAQGIDGALSASRAAYIGGCAGTSNTLAGRLFNIPVKGTHAHSWVMSFDTEIASFEAYADALPDNCIFIVDTYDDIYRGIERAVTVGRSVEEIGFTFKGIRFDIDPTLVPHYRKIAEEKFKENNFKEALVVASNDLDEDTVGYLNRDADVFGVGTNLITARGCPALGGVYKLGAIKQNGEWKNKMKASRGKATYPGALQVSRYFVRGKSCNDLIHFDNDFMESSPCSDRLLKPVVSNGMRTSHIKNIEDIRNNTSINTSCFEHLLEGEQYEVLVNNKIIEEQERLMRELVNV